MENEITPAFPARVLDDRAVSNRDERKGDWHDLVCDSPDRRVLFCPKAIQELVASVDGIGGSAMFDVLGTR